MVRRELTEDITIYHLPLSVPQEIISKTAVIDSDFNDPKIQRQMAQYIMSIRFDYNERMDDPTSNITSLVVATVPKFSMWR